MGMSKLKNITPSDVRAIVGDETQIITDTEICNLPGGNQSKRNYIYFIIGAEKRHRAELMLLFVDNGYVTTVCPDDYITACLTREKNERDDKRNI
jgi:hypothetical protein